MTIKNKRFIKFALMATAIAIFIFYFGYATSVDGAENGALRRIMPPTYDFMCAPTGAGSEWHRCINIEVVCYHRGDAMSCLKRN